jgi:hypothetical protein
MVVDKPIGLPVHKNKNMVLEAFSVFPKERL